MIDVLELAVGTLEGGEGQSQEGVKQQQEGRTTPASFRAIPIEATFNVLKLRFRDAYEKAVDAKITKGDAFRPGEKGQLFLNSIEVAVNQVSRENIKRNYVLQLSKLRGFLNSEKV